MKKEKGDIDMSSFSSSRMDFLDTSSDTVTEDMILEYLAAIITEIVLHEEAEKKQEN